MSTVTAAPASTSQVKDLLVELGLPVRIVQQKTGWTRPALMIFGQQLGLVYDDRTDCIVPREAHDGNGLTYTARVFLPGFTSEYHRARKLRDAGDLRGQTEWGQWQAATYQRLADNGACTETDPEAFFPEKGGSTRDAKNICQGCDIRSTCLLFAVLTEEFNTYRHGVWGGMSGKERLAVKKALDGEPLTWPTKSDTADADDLPMAS